MSERNKLSNEQINIGKTINDSFRVHDSFPIVFPSNNMEDEHRSKKI